MRSVTDWLAYRKGLGGRCQHGWNGRGRHRIACHWYSYAQHDKQTKPAKANLVATRCLPSLKAAYEALVRVHGEYRVRINSDGSMNNEDKTDVLSSLNQYFADEHE